MSDEGTQREPDISIKAECRAPESTEETMRKLAEVFPPKEIQMPGEQEERFREWKASGGGLSIPPNSPPADLLAALTQERQLRETAESRVQELEGERERIEKLLDEFVPRESYEGQGGGIVEWTIEGRLLELCRRWRDSDTAKAWEKADARSKMADAFYDKTVSLESHLARLQEALRQLVGIIEYPGRDDASLRTACEIARSALTHSTPPSEKDR